MRALLSWCCLLAFVGTGCATVNIESTPADAEVALILPGEETVRVIGRTPYAADLDTLSDAVNGGVVTLVVRKRGYLSQHFLVPNIPHTDLRLSTSLLPDLPRNYEEVNRIVALVLKGQRFLLEKRPEDAIKTADAIKAINENIATAFEIEGAAHFMTKKLRESRFAWMRVLELEPENFEAKGMLKLVEARMGMHRQTEKKADNAPTPPPAAGRGAP